MGIPIVNYPANLRLCRKCIKKLLFMLFSYCEIIIKSSYEIDRVFAVVGEPSALLCCEKLYAGQTAKPRTALSILAITLALRFTP